MKRFLSLLGGLAIAITASTAHAQIDWAAGAPGGTPGGSIEIGAAQPPSGTPGTGFFLETGISAAQIAPSQATIDATGVTGDYTIMAWINSSQGAENATPNRWWFGTGFQGLHLGVQGASLPTTGHWNNDSAGTTTITSGTWFHVTHVYRGGAQEIYVNGVLESSNLLGAPNFDDTDLQLGARNGDEGPGWGGLIDDVALFTTALSDPDIATLAADTTQAVALGAVAYWNFEDDQTGTTAANQVVGAGLTGTDGTPAPAVLSGIDGVVPALPSVANWAMGAPDGTSGGSLEFNASTGIPTGINAGIITGNRGGGTLGNDYSVSAWIQSTADDAGNAANNLWWFGTGDQGVHLGIQGSVAAGNSNTLELGHWSADSSGTTVVPSNTWVHVTYTYDADGGLADDGVTPTGFTSIYLNGVLDATANQAAANRSGSDLIIGARNGGAQGWVGFVDDLSIYQAALTQADATALFNDASQAPALGAVAYFDFEDDQTGSTAANSGNFADLVDTSGNPSPAFIGQIEPGGAALKGDVNLSGMVDFSDIAPFIAVLQGGMFQAEADCDCSTVVDFGDIPAFIAILQAQ